MTGEADRTDGQLPAPGQTITSVDCTTAAPADITEKALKPMVEDGVVHLQGAFAKSHVQGWQQPWYEEILPSIAAGTFPYRLMQQPGQRTHATIEIHRRFNTEAFYANPFIVALSERLLEDKYILVSAAVVYSEPGTGYQHIHRDQPLVFSNPRLNLILPPTSLTVCIPLCETNAEIGGTEFVLRSHRELGKNLTSSTTTPVKQGTA